MSVKRSKPAGFMLRLPDGLRDRIRTRAENYGRSMNTEIVRALEKEFPEPWDLTAQINQLTSLMGALRKVRGYDAAIEAMTDAVLDTVEGIASGRVPDLDEASRARVRQSLEDWHLARAEEEEDRAHWYERHDEDGDRDDEPSE